METHVRWFSTLTGGASGRAAGTVAGVASATLNRQLARGELSAEMVIALARGYGRSPVTALVETGYLRAAEAQDLDMIDSTRLLTDQQLVRELARRVDDNDAAWAGTFDEVVESATATVSPKFKPVPVPDTSEAPALPDEFELAARRTGQRKGSDPAGLDDGEE